MKAKKLFSIAGMLGSAIFVIVFLTEGWVRPDYNASSMFVSELSLGPRGWIQIVNFIVFGLLFLMFTRGVVAEFKEGKASKSGPILLTIIATSYLLSGPFVTDPSTIFLGQKSLHGIIHGIFGAIVFSLMPISCFIFLRRFRIDPRWQSFQWPTLMLAVIISAAVILLTLATKFPISPDIFSPWLGLIQRAAIIPYMIWLFIFALQIYRKK